MKNMEIAMDHYITNYNIDPPAGSICAVLEDSIMQKGHPVTTGSKILEGFVSPIDATVVTRLEAAGVCILGKTKMEEFGICGLFGETGDGFKSYSQHETGDGSKSCSPYETGDGSMSHGFRSGAVAAVADGAADFALCNDYTGAVGREAAERGLYYFRPTYGTVSRYGLIPAVQSMDQIGVVCKSPDEGIRVLSIIEGYDPKDGAMLTAASPQQSADADEGSGSMTRPPPAPPNMGNVRLGIPVSVLKQHEKKIKAEDFAGGFEIVEFELKYSDIYDQVMQILCSAELSGNISRYDGVKFGYRAKGFTGINELYTKSRTEALGPDARLAAVLGAMVLSKENYDRLYDKAMRIRRLIKESLEFDRYDVILTPSPCPLPMLCGLPALTMPYRGAGITLVADVGQTYSLFNGRGRINDL